MSKSILIATLALGVSVGSLSFAQQNTGGTPPANIPNAPVPNGPSQGGGGVSKGGQGGVVKGGQASAPKGGQMSKGGQSGS